MNRLRVSMATTTWSILRHARRNQGNRDVIKFCRGISVTSCRKLPEGNPGDNQVNHLDHLKENPFFQKYAGKLRDKQM